MFKMPSIIAIDQAGVDARVARLQARAFKGASKQAALRLALGAIDLTTLEGKDSDAKIEQLCHKALHPCDDIEDLPTVAAVCVYANHVALAKKLLQNS